MSNQTLLASIAREFDEMARADNERARLSNRPEIKAFYEGRSVGYLLASARVHQAAVNVPSDSKGDGS